MDRWHHGGEFSRRVTFNYRDCNENYLVFPHYIFGEFSEIAGDELAFMGETHKETAENMQMFLVTRMSMRVHNIPRCNDTVIFTTWYRGSEGKINYRDCEVRSEDGELLISCSSTWMLFDFLEGCVVTSDKFRGNKNVTEIRKKTNAPDCIKISRDGTEIHLGTRPVYYTDLDCNSHVNNSVYTKIANDFLPRNYNILNINEVLINFNSQTKLSDVFEIYGRKTENGYAVFGMVDGIQHFACEFKF